MRPASAGLTLLAIVAPALVGGAACTLIVSKQTGFSEAAERAPLIYAWVTMLAAQGAIAWAGIAPTAWLTASTWRDVSPASRALLVVTAVILVTLLVVFSVMEPRTGSLVGVTWPTPDHTSRVAWLSAVICIPPTLAIVAMWLSAVAAYESPSAAAAAHLPATAAPIELPATQKTEPAEEAIAKYLEARERIQSLLWYVGVIVACVVLSTGVLRQTLIDANAFAPVTGQDPPPYFGATNGQYPQTLVLAYGAFFTLLLVISYVPAYLLMRVAGNRILAVLVNNRLVDQHQAEGGDPAKKTPDLAAWRDERKQLIDLLGLDVGLDTTLKNTIAILAPLAAGFASMALPGK